jgi:two-component system, OmpR family, sensor kinase
MGTKVLLRSAFGGIAVLFAAVAACMIWRVSSVRQQTRALVADMLEGAEEVARIGREVERERRLIDAHIFERGRGPMARVEREIQATRDNYARAAGRYETLPQPPPEALVWRRLESDIAALRSPVDGALALSRRDEDEAARQAMERLEPRYQAIEASLTSLMRLNRTDAEETLSRVEHLHAKSLWTLGLLALTGIIVSIFVGARVTRRVELAEAELQRQSELLEQRNRELDAFAGRVAHDLRGPLTTLNLAIGNLARANRPERARELMERGIQHMTALIDDLLAFSRAELAQASCEMTAVVAALLDDMSPRLDAAAIRLVTEVEAAEVRCSAGMLKQVLWNLVDNSIKYSRAGVPVEVVIRGQCGNGGYQLSVCDNGMGMSAQEMLHVFEPRYRGEHTGTVGGHGLGLSLVKRVLDAAGGKIAVESELGRGTTFRMVMPLHQARSSSSAKPAAPSTARLRPSTVSVPEKVP